MRIAVFDIGTNSIHMKIVDIHKNLLFEVLDHEKDMTRIGDGSFKDRKLTKKATRRAIGVIRKFVALAYAEGVTRFVAVATSAVRDARNGDDFVKTLFIKTGVRVKVISGEEEARLIFLGVASGTDTKQGKVLVIDIGGGSLELVLGDQKKIYYAESFELGVARLRDRFTPKLPASKKALKQLKAYAQERLKGAAERLRKKGFSTIVGTAGTFINVASMVYEEREGRRLRLRGYQALNRTQFMRQGRKWLKMSQKRLEELPGLENKRADTVAVGMVLIETLFRLLKAQTIFISDKGIREGIILNYIAKSILKKKEARPSIRVQWFGQKPYFAGRITK